MHKHNAQSILCNFQLLFLNTQEWIVNHLSSNNNYQVLVNPQIYILFFSFLNPHYGNELSSIKYIILNPHYDPQFSNCFLTMITKSWQKGVIIWLIICPQSKGKCPHVQCVQVFPALHQHLDSELECCFRRYDL